MSARERGIVYFVTSLTAGGAERVLSGFIENFRGELHVQAIICLLWTPDRRIKDGLSAVCPIIELIGNPSAGFSRQLRYALQVCWLARTAIFHGWMYHGCVMATIFRWLVGAGNSIFWAIHCSGVVEGEAKLLRSAELFGLGVICRLTGARVIFCGENSQKVHVERWLWPMENSRVLKNGINVTRFAPSDEIRREVRLRLGIPEGSVVLGYVGRWHPDKDVDTLHRALASLGSSRPELVVVFCGNGLSQANRGFANALSAVSPSIRCITLGEVSDTSRIMPAFDFLCLCSLREAFPLVLCEALACGVLCISTDVGDCRNIINGFGQVVPPGDFRQLAQAIAEYTDFFGTRESGDTKRAARRWAVEALNETIATQCYLSFVNTHSAAHSGGVSEVDER